MIKGLIPGKVILMKLDTSAVPEPKVLYWCKRGLREEAHSVIDISNNFPEAVARLADLGFTVGVVI